MGVLEDGGKEAERALDLLRKEGGDEQTHGVAMQVLRVE